MELIPEIEKTTYVQMTFKVPEGLVCFIDHHGELDHWEVRQNERRTLGFMLSLVQEKGHLIKMRLIEELFGGLHAADQLDEDDAKELRKLVDECIKAGLTPEQAA